MIEVRKSVCLRRDKFRAAAGCPIGASSIARRLFVRMAHGEGGLPAMRRLRPRIAILDA